MEIEKRHCQILLQALALKKTVKAEASIRTIAPISKMTERECELAVSNLLQDSLIDDIDEIIKPTTSLNLSEKGVEFVKSLNMLTGYAFGSFEALKFEFSQINKDKALSTQEALKAAAAETQTVFETHLWQQMGTYADGAGQITRDKWYPMGSYCKKCGLQTRDFKRKPIVCPKK